MFNPEKTIRVYNYLKSKDSLKTLNKKSNISKNNITYKNIKNIHQDGSNFNNLMGNYAQMYLKKNNNKSSTNINILNGNNNNNKKHFTSREKKNNIFHNNYQKIPFKI